MVVVGSQCTRCEAQRQGGSWSKAVCGGLIQNNLLSLNLNLNLSPNPSKAAMMMVAMAVVCRPRAAAGRLLRLGVLFQAANQRGKAFSFVFSLNAGCCANHAGLGTGRGSLPGSPPGNAAAHRPAWAATPALISLCSRCCLASTQCGLFVRFSLAWSGSRLAVYTQAR